MTDKNTVSADLQRVIDERIAASEKRLQEGDSDTATWEDVTRRPQATMVRELLRLCSKEERKQLGFDRCGCMEKQALAEEGRRIAEALAAYEAAGGKGKA